MNLIYKAIIVPLVLLLSLSVANVWGQACNPPYNLTLGVAPPSPQCTPPTAPVTLTVNGYNPSCTQYTQSVITRAFRPVPANPVFNTPSPFLQVSPILNIGFTFRFYCQNYTQFYVSSEGFITLGPTMPPSGCCGGQFIPNAGTPNNVVAGSWTVLQHCQDIRYETQGVAPNRVLVVEFPNFGFWPNGCNGSRMQIMLYEGSNKIEFHNANVGQPGSFGLTQGVEDATGANALATPGRNSAFVAVTDARCFQPQGNAQLVIRNTTNGFVANNVTNATDPAPPTGNSTYELLAIDPCANCTTTVSVPYTVNPRPNVTINPAGPLTKCTADPPIQLTASGATTYSWSPATGLSDPNIANPTANPTSTTTYTVTGTSNACTNTATITITVNTNPTITINPTSVTRCTSDPPSPLTASGGNTYVWSPATGLSNPNIANPTANPATTTTYTVTGTAANGCTGSATITVTVNPVPNVTINPNAVTRCLNDAPSQLTASGATIYSWTPATGLSNANIPNPTANPAVTTTYIVTGTNASGCQAQATITVTVNNNPTVTINPVSVTKCALDPPVQLTANGAVNYTWTPAAGLSATNIPNPTANPTITTTYTVVGSDANGCTGTATTTVIVNPNPNAPVALTNTNPVCPDQRGTVYSVINTPGNTYTWTVPAQATLITGQGSNQITVDWTSGGVPTPPGNYTITVTTTANGCVSAPLNLTVTVQNPPPGQPLNPSGPTPVCIRSSASYSVTADPTVTNYVWTGIPGGAFISSGFGTNQITINWGIAPIGTYQLQVVAQNSCGQSPPNFITVDLIDIRPQPGIITTPTNICMNQAGTYSVVNDPLATDYTWTNTCGWTNNGSTTNTISYTPTTAGPCVITVVANNQCGSSLPRSITINPRDVPAQPQPISGLSIVCQNSIQNYSVPPVNGVSYAWGPLPPGATYVSGQNTNTARINWGNTAPGIYTIDVTPSNSCGNGTPQTIEVTVISVPTQPILNGNALVCVNSAEVYNVTNPEPNTTYTWTVSPAGPILSPSGSSVTVQWLTAGNYILTATPSNQCGNGTPGSIAVTVTTNLTATISPAIQNTCNNSYVISGVNPLGGTFACVSCPGGATVDPNTGVVSGMTIPNQPYTFSYTVSGGVCPPSTAYVTVQYLGVIAGTAGTPQTVCQNASGNINLTGYDGNIIRWERSTDCITFSAIQNTQPTLTYINLTQTTCFRAVVGRANCPTVNSNAVVITVVNNVTATATPASQTVCSDNATVSGNLPPGVTGNWTFISGPTIATITTFSGNGNITGMTAQGVYRFRWTLTNPPCQPSSVDVTVTRLPNLTVPNAGNDFQVCSNVANLIGNIPVSGTASWSFVSGPVVPSVTNVNPNIGLVNGLTQPGFYVFRYTISSGNCTPLTDDVVVERINNPTQANAGLDVTTCDNFVTLQGNIPPIVGVGTWSFVTGPTVPAIVPIGHLANVTGMNVPGNYIFRYTITNPPCTPTTDDVIVTVVSPPSLAQANPLTYDICDITATSIRAIQPTIGTGTWSLVSAPGGANPVIFTQGVNGNISGMTQPGAYVFRWTVTNPPCPQSSSVDVVVNREERITGNINPGPFQTLCNNVTTTTLTAQTPLPPRSTGEWVYVSGPEPGVIVTTFGLVGNVINLTQPGIYVFEWRVRRLTGSCPAVSAPVIVEVKPLPTTANAGLDQTICGTGPVSLIGNQPQVGTGAWSFVSGPMTPNTSFSGNNASVSNMTMAGTYCFRWTISNAPCPPSTDDVCINVSIPPIGGTVSSNQTVCAGTNSGTVNLTGHSGTIVRWESSTDNFTTITNIANNTTSQLFTNLTQTTQFRAVISSGTCPVAYSNPVTITVAPLPVTANAGNDQTFCGGFSSTIVTANPVPNGMTGTWSYVGLPGQPFFTTNNNELRVFNVNTPGIYTFRWTVSSPPCNSSSDDVDIIVLPASAGGLLSANATVCAGNNSGTLFVTGHVGNVVRWETSTDNGFSWTPIFINTTSLPYNNVATPTQYRVVVQNGSCPESKSNIVTINVSQPPTVANAGPDQNFCGNIISTTLVGNTPLAGTGTWTLVSQPNGANASVSTNGTIGSVTGMTVDGSYTFRWTITNPPCPPSMDEVVVTRVSSSIAGNLSANAVVCSGSNTGTLTLNGHNGNILRWESSTDNFATVTNISVTTNTLNYLNLTQTTSYRAVVQGGSCTPANSNVVTITVQNTTPPADPGPTAVTVCGSSATLTAVAPPIGQGVWSYVSGPMGFVGLSQTGTVVNISGMTAVGSYTFRWTVNNPPCPSTSADVVVTRLPDGLVANAGADVTQCTPNIVLTGNDPTPHTSVWSFVSGPVIPTLNQTGVNYNVTGMNVPGTYVFRYTINQAPCPPSSDDVVVTVLQAPSPAMVQNTNITVCDVNETILVANPPVHGTGTWSFIGGPVAATVTTAGNNGNVSGMSVNGAYVFRWTVTNPPCNQVSFVDVTVNRQNGVTVQAFAGANQTVCNTQFALVMGNTPPPGTTGTWSFVTGPAPASITTIGVFGSISGMSLPGSYQFAWTISANNGCPSSSSIVTITRNDPPTIANAGPNQTVCGSTAILTGNIPTSGTGTWSFVSGPPPLPNISVNNTTATVTNMLTPGVYVFRWTIANPPCTPSSSDVAVTVNQGSVGGVLTGANTACSGSNNGSLTVTGYNGSIVRWESSTDGFLSVNIINNTTASQPYNNLTQTTCYRAVVKDGGCPEATSNIQCITVTPPTTIADAGPDQTICANNTTLIGNVPQSGNGTWSFVAGPVTPTLTPVNNTLVVTNMTVQGVYLFRWRIDNGLCGSTQDLVSVTVNAPSNAGNASGAATVCAGTNSGTVTLTGFTGSILSWEFSIDNGATWTAIGNTTPSQAYSNLTQTTWYRAVVQNNIVCPVAYSNPVQITVRQPEIANAGSNQVICGTNTITLNGNQPVTGTPLWQFISGPTTPTLTQSGASVTVTNMNVGGTYTFRYSINNAPCALSTSDVSVQVSATPVAGTITMPMTVCETANTATLTLTGHVGNVIQWESSEDNFASSTVTILNPNPQLTFFNLTRTTWYRAVVSAPGCSNVTSAPVRITVVAAPSVADAGLDQTICSSAVTLTGNVPVNGTPTWTVQFAQPGSNVTITQSGNVANINGMTVPGNYVFQYQIANPPCAASADIVQITVLGNTQAGTITGNATVCNGLNSGNIVLTGNNAPVVRWEFSFDNGVSWQGIGNFTNVQTYSNLNQNTLFRAVIQQAGCPEVFTNQVLITVVDPANAGTVSGDATVCAGNNGGTLTLSGHSGTIVRWEQSVDGFNWSNLVNNTNTQFYSNLTVTTYFRAIIQNACGNNASSVGTITVTGQTVAGTVNSPATVCAGNNSGTLTLTGNVGNVVTWETSTDGITFTANGNTSTNQTYTNLNQTTFYRAVVQNGVCGQVRTNIVAVTVVANSNGGTLSSPATVCPGNNNGTLTLTGNVGTILRWEFSTDNGNTWQTINNTGNAQTYTNINVDTRYRVAVQSGSCGVVFSNVVQITILPNSAGGVANGSATVCSGNNNGTITLTNFVGTILRWESSTDGINFFPINNNTPNLSYTNLVQTTFYRAVVANEQCGGQTFSTLATITVSFNTNGGTLTGAQTVCGTFASGTLNLTGHSGTIIRWESSNDGFNFSPINNTTPSLSYSVAQTTFYRVLVQNGSCPSAFSNTVIVALNPPSVAGTVSGGGTVCAGNNSGVLNLNGHQGTILRWESSVDGGNTWSPINNNTPTLTFNNVSQNTLYRAVVQNGSCLVAVSNSVAVTLGSNIQITTNVTIGCTGSGTIQATATGGVGSYTYTISPNILPENNNGIFTPVNPGTYTITVFDGAGCSRSTTVNVGNTPSAPSIGSVMNITTSSAVVSWPAVPPGVGIIYTFRYRILGSQTWTTISNITATNITLSGLQNNTTYEIALAYQCCGTCPLSAFSNGNVTQFTTQGTGDCSVDPVPVPGGFYVGTVTQTTARVHWNRVIGAIGYIVSYGPITQNPNFWTQDIVCDPINTYLINNLAPNTNYGVRIRTNCSNCTTALNNFDRRSVFSVSLSFRTLANRAGEITELESSNMEVYPNPNKGQFTVRFESANEVQVNMVMVDALGREVYRRQTSAIIGTNEWMIEPEQGLTSGVYLLRLKVGEEDKVIKVVVE